MPYLEQSDYNGQVRGILGRGTVFSHFTDTEGATGITGVDAASLNLNQWCQVNHCTSGEALTDFLLWKKGLFS